jgi:hypothetical protein
MEGRRSAELRPVIGHPGMPLVVGVFALGGFLFFFSGSDSLSFAPDLDPDRVFLACLLSACISGVLGSTQAWSERLTHADKVMRASRLISVIVFAIVAAGCGSLAVETLRESGVGGYDPPALTVLAAVSAAALALGVVHFIRLEIRHETRRDVMPFVVWPFAATVGMVAYAVVWNAPNNFELGGLYTLAVLVSATPYTVAALTGCAIAARTIRTH